jgi:AAHS family 4-hydroxybenzoate transporter-like MFS transporter
VGYLVAAGKSGDRIRRTLVRIFPDLAIPNNTRFERVKETAPNITLLELFRSGRATGTLLLWASFFFAFMILVTNSAWSPILLRRVGIAPEHSALALALFNFGALFGSAAAGWLLSRFGTLRLLPPTLVLGAMAYAVVGWSAPSFDAVMMAEGLSGLLLGCASSGLIALAAIFYPVAIRSTGVGWATGIGRLGSFTGPLLVGQLVGAQWDVRTIFASVGGLVLISALSSALMALLPPAGLPDALPAATHTSLHA